MAETGGPEMGPGWVQTLAEIWPLGAVLIGHLIRTETTRAVLRRDVDALSAQRTEDMRRIDGRLDEIAADIKTLLRR